MNAVAQDRKVTNPVTDQPPVHLVTHVRRFLTPSNLRPCYRVRAWWFHTLLGR